MIKTKGKMAHVNGYEVECGAHGCSVVAFVTGAHHARHLGWHLDKRGGYGWICPKCQEFGPLPEDQS